jgi:DNA-binding transcriptional LysR family regulator
MAVMQGPSASGETLARAECGIVKSGSEGSFIVMLHARILTYIDEVVRQGSIRRAADRLNVASSAISRQILTLEDLLGVSLFDRSGRRLKPTAAGELMVAHIRETLKGMTVVRAQIDELQGLHRGSITIGVMSGLAANVLPAAVANFQDTNPRVEVRVHLMNTGDQILSAVERGEIELGLGFDFGRHSNIRVTYSTTGRLGAVMSPTHPLAKEKSLRLANIVAYPLAMADQTMAIRPYIDDAFTRSSLRPITMMQTNAIEVMRRMAMLGKSITFLTPFDIEADRQLGTLIYIPVHEFVRHEQRLMLVQNDRRSDALASVFAERLKKSISEIAVHADILPA